MATTTITAAGWRFVWPGGSFVDVYRIGEDARVDRIRLGEGPLTRDDFEAAVSGWLSHLLGRRLS